MKKIRKGKKTLLILLAIIAVIIITVIITVVVKNVQKQPNEPEEQVIIQLPETTYSDMQVKNIVMELLKGNAQDGGEETVVTFEIHNTTNKKVESQFFEAVLIGSDENVIARMPHNYIQSLDVGQVHRINVVYKGDLTATKQIKQIEE